MNTLWKVIGKQDLSKRGKMRWFLVLNCIKYSLLGFFVWLVVRNFAFDTIDWAFCFIGYPGFFFGFLGGYLFLCRE